MCSKCTHMDFLANFFDRFVQADLYVKENGEVWHLYQLCDLLYLSLTGGLVTTECVSNPSESRKQNQKDLSFSLEETFTANSQSIS